MGRSRSIPPSFLCSPFSFHFSFPLPPTFLFSPFFPPLFLSLLSPFLLPSLRFHTFENLMGIGKLLIICFPTENTSSQEKANPLPLQLWPYYVILSSVQELTSFSPHTTCEVCSVTARHLSKRVLRHREYNQGHKATKWQSQDKNPGCVAPESQPFNTC